MESSQSAGSARSIRGLLPTRTLGPSLPHASEKVLLGQIWGLGVVTTIQDSPSQTRVLEGSWCWRQGTCGGWLGDLPTPTVASPALPLWTNQTNCDKTLVISGKTIKSLRLQLKGNVLSGGKRPVMGRPAPPLRSISHYGACISLSSTLQTPPEHLNYRVKIRIITRLKPITLIRGRY